MSLMDLVGKTLTSVVNHDNERLVFNCTDGAKFAMFHNQDCCESVTIDDICGDLDDLVGSPIIIAEEVSQNTHFDGATKVQESESYTWTFYRIGTAKGLVTIRWYGESSGYYSELVNFDQTAQAKEITNA